MHFATFVITALTLVAPCLSAAVPTQVQAQAQQAQVVKNDIASISEHIVALGDVMKQASDAYAADVIGASRQQGMTKIQDIQEHMDKLTEALQKGSLDLQKDTQFQQQQQVSKTQHDAREVQVKGQGQARQQASNGEFKELTDLCSYDRADKQLTADCIAKIQHAVSQGQVLGLGQRQQQTSDGKFEEFQQLSDLCSYDFIRADEQLPADCIAKIQHATSRGQVLGVGPRQKQTSEGNTAFTKDGLKEYQQRSELCRYDEVHSSSQLPSYCTEKAKSVSSSFSTSPSVSSEGQGQLQKISSFEARRDTSSSAQIQEWTNSEDSLRADILANTQDMTTAFKKAISSIVNDKEIAMQGAQAKEQVKGSLESLEKEANEFADALVNWVPANQKTQVKDMKEQIVGAIHGVVNAYDRDGRDY